MKLTYVAWKSSAEEKEKLSNHKRIFSFLELLQMQSDTWLQLS